MVAKNICPSDKRLVDITLTAKGLALVERLDQYNDQIDAILQGVSEKEAATLNQILDKLRSLPDNK